jgi:prepilin-type N-terminal cleavage/methylation domain-containing protein
MGRQSGLTLIELMIALAVAVVLLAVGVPALQSLGANNRVTSATNGLVAALRLARGEAVNRATSVSVCALASRFTAGAAGACASSGAPDWSNGFRVFTDDDAGGTNGSYDSSNEDELRLWNALDSDLGLAVVNANADAVRAFRFNLLGEAQHYVQSDSAVYEVDVLADITHSDGTTNRRCVQVLASGLLRTYVQPNSANTCNDSNLL